MHVCLELRWAAVDKAIHQMADYFQVKRADAYICRIVLGSNDSLLRNGGSVRSPPKAGRKTFAI